MNDWECFTRAICENPQDIALRLVAADWLEERGDMRGEFVRVQCDSVRNRSAARSPSFVDFKSPWQEEVGASVNLEERKRLDEIELLLFDQAESPTRAQATKAVDDLRAFARRAEAAEERLQTFLRDRGADEGWNAARDALLISEAGKMAARECIHIDGTLGFGRSGVAEAIAKEFSLDANPGPTLSQRVAQECCEIIAGRTLPSAVNAIRRRFGLETQKEKVDVPS